MSVDAVPVEIEIDKRQRRAVAERVELALAEPQISCHSAEAVAREAGGRCEQEPDWQGDQHPKVLVGRKDEKERNADSGDEDSPAGAGGKGDGCADEVATEFGDHPEAATRRMSWARGELAYLASWGSPDHVMARAELV